MQRREFITLFGSAAAAWPLAAHAQQRATRQRIAIFHPAIPATLLTETGGGSAWRAFFAELRRLGYIEGENLIIVSVTDTGIGIPPAHLGAIFEPFHQLDGSTTRRYGGTGLGLSLVRQIVEAHGSMLEVQSIEGRGSTFKFPLLVAMSSNKN